MRRSSGKYRMIQMRKYQRGFIHIFLLILIVIVGIGAIGYFAYKNGRINLTPSNIPLSSPTPIIQTYDNFSNFKKLCEDRKGKWLSEFNECEGSSETGIANRQCTDLGGSYSECSSVCRHDPRESEIPCVAVCVEVCKFN